MKQELLETDANEMKVEINPRQCSIDPNMKCLSKGQWRGWTEVLNWQWGKFKFLSARFKNFFLLTGDQFRAKLAPFVESIARFLPKLFIQ